MKVTHQQGDPRSLKLLEDNARYMRHETFQRLVKNIKRDGVLQQWPFVYADPETGEKTVLSGNHRVKAAIEAGLEVIDWTECDTPLTVDQQKQIQLSHNAIVGEDDPEMLKRIYDSIQDVEEKLASGLDDATLDLMFASSTTSLSEANLDFQTLTFVFLQHERERALKAFDEAKSMSAASEFGLARMDQYNRTLDAIEDAREAAHVMNLATALDVLLDVWDANRTELRNLWMDDEGELRHAPSATVPTTSIFGMSIRGDVAKAVVKAMNNAMSEGSAKTTEDVLAQWANYTRPTK